jgi:hypothetical protein
LIFCLSGRGSNAKHAQQQQQQQQTGNKPYKAGEEIEMEINPAALAQRDSNLSTIQQFGREVKALAAESDTNLAALHSSSMGGSRPGSRASSASSGGGRMSRSQERAASRTGKIKKKREKKKPEQFIILTRKCIY